MIYWNGTRDELAAWAQRIAPVEETWTPAPLKMRVGVPVLNVRSGPGRQYADLGDLHGNQVVDVYNVAGAEAWVEIAPGKWACAYQGHEQYLVKDEG